MLDKSQYSKGMATIFVSGVSQAGSKNSVHWVESRIKSLSRYLDLSVSAF